MNISSASASGMCSNTAAAPLVPFSSRFTSLFVWGFPGAAVHGVTAASDAAGAPSSGDRSASGAMHPVVSAVRVLAGLDAPHPRCSWLVRNAGCSSSRDLIGSGTTPQWPGRLGRLVVPNPIERVGTPGRSPYGSHQT